MSLVAEVANRRIDATQLAPEEWRQMLQSIRDGTVVPKLDCCEGRINGRHSPLGTPHFYHLTLSECPSGGHEMSPEHLMLQQRVATACRNTGWHAICEANMRERRADVMATNANRRVAFEVQISPITRHDLEARTQFYLANGIEPVWLMGPEMGHERFQGCPIAKLSASLDELEVSGRTLFVDEFVGLILNGRLKHKPTRAVVKVTTTWRHARQVTCIGCMTPNLVARLMTEHYVRQGCQDESRKPLPQQPALMLVPNDSLRAWLASHIQDTNTRIADGRPSHGEPTYSCALCGLSLHHLGQLGIPLDIPDIHRDRVVVVQKPHPHWCLDGAPCSASPSNP